MEDILSSSRPYHSVPSIRLSKRRIACHVGFKARYRPFHREATRGRSYQCPMLSSIAAKAMEHAKGCRRREAPACHDRARRQPTHSPAAVHPAPRADHTAVQSLAAAPPTPPARAPVGRARCAVEPRRVSRACFRGRVVGKAEGGGADNLPVAAARTTARGTELLNYFAAEVLPRLPPADRAVLAQVCGDGGGSLRRLQGGGTCGYSDCFLFERPRASGKPAWVISSASSSTSTASSASSASSAFPSSSVGRCRMTISAPS